MCSVYFNKGTLQSNQEVCILNKKLRKQVLSQKIFCHVQIKATQWISQFMKINFIIIGLA